MQRITIASHQIQADRLALTSDQQHYLCRVLRLAAGDQFQAIDGQGALYLAMLQTAGAKILAQPQTLRRELPVPVNLILGIPKSGLDDVIRACTELGVSNFYPVTSDRTIPKPSHHKQQRWQKIAQEATEQCERIIVPIVHEPQPWKTLRPQLTGQKFICIARETSSHLANCPLTADPIFMAIGPEGGWTEQELEQSIAQGWQPVSLGSRILRAVTAPITAISIVGSILESSANI